MRCLKSMRRATAVITIIYLMLFIACGGGGSSSGNPWNPPNNNPSNPPGGNPVTPPSGTTLSEALRELEESGEIPALDRSTTIQGVDANSDGVRDDIEQYIESLPDTPAQKSALRQVYKALSSAMQPISGTDTAYKITNAVNCLADRYPDDYYEKMNDIRKYTVNTKVRFDAYMEFNRNLYDSTVSLPEGNTCE